MTADSLSATAKLVVTDAVGELFDHRDMSAIDRYWSSRYVEHSVACGEGLDGLRETVVGLPDGFRHERLRLLVDGDLVVAHGIYHGLGPTPIVAFDPGWWPTARSPSIGTPTSTARPRPCRATR